MGLGKDNQTKPTDPNKFKKTEGSLTYASYLKVSELTSLQTPLSNPTAHDELLFIIVHQTYELWFKQVLFELESVIQLVLKDDLHNTFRRLDRICEIFRVLVQQIDVLETMTPVEFNRFRSHLNPASGFQSLQFKELEVLMGADTAEYQKFLKFVPEWKEKLSSRLRHTNLRAAFLQLLAMKGILPSRDPKELPQALLGIYQGTDNQPLHSLCEHLIRLDELLLLWRFRHVQMVERMIGMKQGTGGSLGVPYLQATLQRRFFPELWESRTLMT